MDYNFSVTEELTALFIRDQKILSTCNEWKILNSDQLTFISWLLGVLAFSLGNLCYRGTGKSHPKKFRPTRTASHNSYLSFRLILHSVILYWPAGVEEQHYGKRIAWILHTNLKQAEQQGTRKYYTFSFGNENRSGNQTFKQFFNPYCSAVELCEEIMTTIEMFNVNLNKLQRITTAKALATVGKVTDLWYSFPEDIEQLHHCTIHP